MAVRFTLSSLQWKDEHWMLYAQRLADKAETQGEVPVGAVLVKNNQVLGEGWNQSITHSDPSAHAEIMALRSAGQSVNNYRLPDTTLYVTLEPCVMCAGALRWAQLNRLIIGAPEPKTGFSRISRDIVHPKTLITSGVLDDECAALMQEFFQKKRK